MKNILRWTVLGALFVVPFVPFVISSSLFFPFITGKNLLFRTLVDVAAVAWVLLILYDRSFLPRRSLIGIAMAAFVGVIAIADIFGENFFRSFWSNFERMEGLVTLLHLLAYFCILSSVMRAEKLWHAFWNTSIAASVLMAIYGFYQLSGGAEIHQGGVRLDGTLGNATYLAAYMLFHIFLTIWSLYRTRDNKALTVLYLVALVLQSLALYFTATRGATLGVIGGVALAFLLVAVWGRKEHPNLRRYSLGVIGVIVALVLGFFVIRDTAFVQESPVLTRFADISFDIDSTVGSRYLLWTKIGWQGFLERPVLGWGQDNFITVFGKYYHPDMYMQEPWFDRAHNVFIDWLIAGGILGLLAYLFLFGSGVVTLWQKSGLVFFEKAIFTGLLAAYFFHNLFVFDNIVSYILFVSVLAFIHHEAIEGTTEKQQKHPHHTVDVRPSPIVTGVVVLAGLVVFWYSVVPVWGSGATLIRAIKNQQVAGNHDAAFVLFERALAYNTAGRNEIREQFATAGMRAVQADVPDTLKVGFVERVDEELTAMIEEDPGNTRPLFFKAFFESRTGRHAQAEQTWERALSINPNRQIFLVELGQVEQVQGKLREALETYGRAVEIGSPRDEARVHYATVAYLLGDKEVVAEQITVFEERVFGDPENAEAQFSLGVIYLNTGSTEKAIAAFERAGQLNPDFAPQAQAIVEALRSGKKIQLVAP